MFEHYRMAVPPAQRRHLCVVHWLCRLIALLATALPASAQAPDMGLLGHGGPIRSIAVLDAKTVVTGGFDAAIIVWDIPSGTARRVLRFHDGAVTALGVLGGIRSGCFVSGGEDGRIAEWCLDWSNSVPKFPNQPKVSTKAQASPITAFAILRFVTTEIGRASCRERVCYPV